MPPRAAPPPQLGPPPQAPVINDSYDVVAALEVRRARVDCGRQDARREADTIPHRGTRRADPGHPRQHARRAHKVVCGPARARRRAQWWASPPVPIAAPLTPHDTAHSRTATIAHITGRLARLAEAMRDPRLAPHERFKLLVEIGDECSRFKLGGEDKIRVAGNACEFVRSGVLPRRPRFRA